ncbi:MAG: helix-turn-helix domain-containing protein [Eubacteriaceae bacterium]
MNAFKDILLYLRKRTGLTQVELAKKLEISHSSIAMYESGKREPSVEKLEEIADFFNVDISFLLGKGSENVKQEPYYINSETREIAEHLYHRQEQLPMMKKLIQLNDVDLALVKHLIERLAR